MKLLLNFILSISMFLYGIELFSNSLGNIETRIKTILENYTNSPKRGIFLGTILTSIVQSSSIVMIITIGLVNSNVISFHSSLGIMMGSNLGTCITSWITSFMSKETISNSLLNMNTYIPILFFLGLLLYFKERKRLSSLFIGYALFLFGLYQMQTTLHPIMEYSWFKELMNCLKNPILGILIGVVTTCLVQSSSATIAILQTISNKKKLTYYMATPIILGENIGSCITTLISCIHTNKNAKKVALSHLFYNIIGTFIFILLFYIFDFFKLNFLNYQVNSNSIALIHTLFNFLSILIFFPFLNSFESFINKIVKDKY